jgi:hypothetical protein
MDPNYLMLSLLFSVIGMALVVFGRKSQRFPHIMAGIALMAFPYFITNLIALTLVGVILSIAPFVVPQTR